MINRKLEQQKLKEKRLKELEEKKKLKEIKKLEENGNYAKYKLNEIKQQMNDIDHMTASKLFGFDDVETDELKDRWVFT